MDTIHFNAGNPIIPFNELVENSWCTPFCGSFRKYPESIAALTDQSFKHVPAFLRKHGLFPFSEETRPSQNMCFSYGVTHAFHQVMTVLCQNMAALNQARSERNLSPLQPAIVAPMPTYTFLFNGLKKMGVHVIPVHRNYEDNWKLSPDAVSETLRDIRQENRFLAIGYYDNNPNNPTGRIRDHAETSELAEVFDKHNHEMNELDKATFGSNCKRQTGETHRLKIIEDMIYWKTELTDKKETASFINVPSTQQDTVVLLGLSKWGLPGLRAAFSITDRSLNRHIFRNFYNSCNYAPHPSFTALGKAFSNEKKDANRREQHLQELNEKHHYGLSLLRTLISGSREARHSNSMLDRMIEDVALSVGDKHQAAKILKVGTPEIKLASSFPEAGFFQLLDFSALLGKVPSDTIQGLPQKRYGRKISSMRELNVVFESFGVRYLKGSVVGLSGFTPIMRANAGLHPQEIVRGILRTQKAIRHLHN